LYSLRSRKGLSQFLPKRLPGNVLLRCSELATKSSADKMASSRAKRAPKSSGQARMVPMVRKIMPACIRGSALTSVTATSVKIWIAVAAMSFLIVDRIVLTSTLAAVRHAR
jgi:hypothetical protein